MLAENKKYLKLTVLYFLLIVGMVFLIFKFGITGAVEISSLFQKYDKSAVPPNLSESIIPEPQLYPITEATNSANVPISGYSLPNQKVEIFINDLGVKSLDVNSEGKFEGNIFLSLGLSKIYAITINTKGNKSLPSKSWTVFYNNSPPYLEVLEPSNNTTVKRNPDIVIKGKVTPPSKAYVNDHQMILNNEGQFSYPARLQNGENKFKIVSVDPAQNKTELEWILNYQP